MAQYAILAVSDLGGGMCASRLQVEERQVLFFSNEGSPREPMHVHAEGPGGEAKFWLQPEARVAASVGFDRRTLAEMVAVVEQHRDDIERAWHEHFG